jgi:hypothetical protein
MAKYITNIQLEDADEKDYDKLLLELRKESFKDETPAKGGKSSVSGKMAYSREGNLSLQEVSRAVYRAASKIGKKYSFFVIKNKPVTHSN